VGEEHDIEAAKADPAAFALLYEEHFDAIYAYVSRRSATRADAEDLTSTVFQRALAGLPDFQWRGVPFRAWLFRIAANEVARRRPATADTLEDDVAVEDAAFAQAEDEAVVLGLLRLLPREQRQVLTLRFAEDRSIADVAQEMGRSVGAVKQLQHRALDTLRRQRGAR
jgi:RNA polymerase sigma-70 factor (ECF subfamily)